ncbi:protein kintoun-like [Musca domestica]|uniref:Protein kintoun n=1 Tax=Musca domestica TaxID=7370 RepID=A0A1I8M764_MUSDO|nr:protein kintoun-like [Musca domestica]XP_058981514.1 protein kintoun-like [Musca domestica]
MSSATTIPSTAHHNSNTTQLSTANCKATRTASPPPSSSAASVSQFDITKDEFERISEALKKEEFRKLFLDYIEEIQDPENRKRYEDEIKQIEAERGVDVIFVHPQPGFVIKTSRNGEQKCFINCAKNEHVGKPTSQVSLNHATGQKGLSWSIPMAQAPPRDDFDNNKKRCCVYDVVFHPDALYLAEKNSAFHKCLVDTALDAVEREYKVTLDRVNIKFPKLQYKGLPRPTVIRKLSKTPSKDAEEPHPLEHMYPAKPTADTEAPKILPMKSMENMNKKSEYCTPKYTLTHRHDVDLSQYTNELDAKLNATKPRELVVDIELPLLNSSNECQLDVTEKSIFLLSDKVGSKYRLNLDLPLKVDDKNGSAKFDVDTRHLVITLPVIQTPLAIQREMHESLLHLNREDSGVESDMLNEDLVSSTAESPVEELNSTPLDEVLQKAVNNVAAKAGDSFLKSNVDYQLPNKFDCNVLDNTMSLILQVRNVQDDSIQMQQHEHSLEVQFSSVGSGYYPTYYAFYIQLTDSNSEMKINKVDAEAWENNVILNIYFNQTAENLTSYLAGLDSDHLKEYYIYGKTKMAHKSRQRQKVVAKHLLTEPTNMDITIERSECDKSVDIEIKPRLAENSTCNTNTTEDEDCHGTTSASADNNSTQNSKKLNKKQKRKNKKRRSLSESACDDIKAYQQQQQQDQLDQQQKQLQDQQQQEKTSNVITENEADVDADDDEDDEDSSPERCDKSSKPPHHPISSSMNVPSALSSSSSSNAANLNCMGQQQQRNKQRSFSESRDSVISLSAGSCSYKGILKHYSRYGPRPSLTDSCSSIDECSSSAYSTSVDGMANAFNALRFSQSFSDIPEENVVGLSESCKKTVRFSEVIRKQVFRLDSSILGQRKKNQKRRDRKQRALQRRLSEGDSADYEDNKPMVPLPTSNSSAQYLKTKNNCNNNGVSSTATNKNGNNKAKDKKSNQKNNRPRLESESSSDVDNHKNAMMFEMDM